MMMNIDPNLYKIFGDRACGMMGALDALSGFASNLLIFVHGDRGCMTSTFSEHIFISNMGDVEIISGGEKLLKSTIDEVLASQNSRPDALVIISTCLSEMIGDDIVSIADDVEEKHRVPVIPLKLNGMTPLLPYEIASQINDNFGQKFVVREETDSNRLGLIGYPDSSDAFYNEIQKVLKDTDFHVSPIWPNKGLNALKSINKSHCIFYSDRAIFSGLIKHISATINAKICEFPTPYALSAIIEFYNKIAENVGDEHLIKNGIDAEIDELQNTIEKFKREHGGKRIAVSFGNNRKGTSIESIVHLGIGYVPVLIELGLTPVMIALSEKSNEKEEQVGRLIEQLGGNYRCYFHRTPQELSAILLASHFDLAINESCQKRFIDDAGVSYLHLGKFQPGLSGLKNTISLLDVVLS